MEDDKDLEDVRQELQKVNECLTEKRDHEIGDMETDGIVLKFRKGDPEGGSSDCLWHSGDIAHSSKVLIGRATSRPFDSK